MEIIKGQAKDIYSWCPEVEAGAMEQANNMANLPFIFHHVALMPDCHQGYGMPIGGVMATMGAVVPNAVGVDIGCGMYAVKTNLLVKDIPSTDLRNCLDQIAKRIPLGFNRHGDKCHKKMMPKPDRTKHSNTFIYDREFEKARYQMGTLGGGNHFIELQADEYGLLWFMIHSGSRNLGKQIADYYNGAAKEMNERYHSSVPSSWQLSYIPEEEPLYNDYLTEMNLAVDYALANRECMADVVRALIKAYIDPYATFGVPLNIAHNYAAMEHHYGKNVLVHRKGATKAYWNEYGIIPGSQGTPSYIVEGQGSMMSFQSCSHGAGRVMGRKAATRELDFETEIAKMGDIIHGMKTKKDLDEAPGSYKDIVTVMENQQDLVHIVNELTPLGAVKG